MLGLQIRFILMFFVMSSLFICRVIFLETNCSKGWNKYVGFTLAFCGGGFMWIISKKIWMLYNIQRLEAFWKNVEER